MIQELRAGDRQIPASGWNEMRAAVQGITPAQQQYQSAARNPVYITVKNVTGSDLPAFSVVKLSGATYTRTGDTFINQAIANGVELDGDTPAAATDTIAITQAACAAGEFVKAIVSGATACMINKAENKAYKYAAPTPNQAGYLTGTDDVTGIRVLWIASGTGNKEAFIICDASGTPEKETFLLYSSGSWNPSDYIKGNLEYIAYSIQYNAWVPIVTSNPQPSDFAKCRLVVCQEDMPSNVTGDYYMPYYPLEDNIGVMPNISTVSSESFVNRCGVLYGEHVLSNKRIDYFFKAGRYAYEPYFITVVYAEAHSGGNSGVYCTINGVQYPVAIGYANNENLAPDIYAGDYLCVRVETTNRGDVYSVTAISGPTDEREGSVSIAIGGYGGKSGRRGWDKLSVLPNPLPSEYLYILARGGHNTTINSCASSQAVVSYTLQPLGIEWWIKRKTNALI